METDSATRPAFYSTCNRVLSREERGRGHVVPQISTSGAIPLLPLSLRRQGHHRRLTARKHTCTIPNRLLSNNEDLGNKLQHDQLVLWYLLFTGVTGNDRRTRWICRLHLLDRPCIYPTSASCFCLARRTIQRPLRDLTSSQQCCCRFKSSGTLCRVAGVTVPDVSEDRTYSSSVSSTSQNYSSNGTA